MADVGLRRREGEGAQAEGAARQGIAVRGASLVGENALTAVILAAALLGGPVSTTQVMSSAIMGVGAAERVKRVRWLVLQDMVTAWLLTIPVTAALSGLAYLLLTQIRG